MGHKQGRQPGDHLSLVEGSLRRSSFAHVLTPGYKVNYVPTPPDITRDVFLDK